MIENEYIYETEEGILIDELDNSKLILLPELLNKNYEKLEKYYIELIMPHDIIDEMNQTIIFKDNNIYSLSFNGILYKWPITKKEYIKKILLIKLLTEKVKFLSYYDLKTGKIKKINKKEKIKILN